jgi:hypothetical protein
VALRKGSWFYIGTRGAGGFGGTRVGEHTLGGPAAHLLTFQVNSDVVDGKIREDAPPAQLYDLSADPSQKENLYDKHPDKVEEMRMELAEKMKARRTAPIQ